MEILKNDEIIKTKKFRGKMIRMYFIFIFNLNINLPILLEIIFIFIF